MGLSESFTEEELKKAYKALARKYHPDVAGSGATEMFIQVKKAYDLLSVFQSSVAEMLLTHQTIFSIVKN